MSEEQQIADASVATPEGAHLLELWSDREEVHALPEILRPDEGLVAVSSGTVLRSGRLAHPRWLVVLTDRRLLCIKGRVAVTRKVIDMPISAIRSVDKKRFLRSTLVVETGYGTLRITGMKNASAAEITDGLAALKAAASREGAGRGAAIRRADIPGAGSAAGADSERVMRLEEAVHRLRQDLSELQDQVALLKDAGRRSGQQPAGM